MPWPRCDAVVAQNGLEREPTTDRQAPSLEAQAAFPELQAAELRHEAERLSDEACPLRAAAQSREAVGPPSPSDDHVADTRRSNRAARNEHILTARQREILSLIVRGHTNRQIAEKLVITPGTAANHVAQMLGRVGLQNRVQPVAWALENRHISNRAVSSG